jgi:hypothetical protein
MALSPDLERVFDEDPLSQMKFEKGGHTLIVRNDGTPRDPYPISLISNDEDILLSLYRGKIGRKMIDTKGREIEGSTAIVGVYTLDEYKAALAKGKPGRPPKPKSSKKVDPEDTPAEDAE